MSDNKAILEAANAALLRGDNEGFLRHCTEDTEWNFIGEQTLRGKEAVRTWMRTAYAEPPKFDLALLIADGDFVTALGDIFLKDEEGREVRHAYCDVWQFREGKLASLRAFVIPYREAAAG